MFENPEFPAVLSNPPGTEHLASLRLYNKAEAARMLGMCTRKLEGIMLRRLISFRRIGGSIRFTIADLDAFIENSRVPSLDEMTGPARRKPAFQKK